MREEIKSKGEGEQSIAQEAQGARRRWGDRAMSTRREIKRVFEKSEGTKGMTDSISRRAFSPLCRRQLELKTEEKAITGIFIRNGTLAGSAFRIRGWTRE